MSLTLTPAQRSLRARIAALSRVSKPDYDPHAATRAANSARWERYFDQVDPQRKLPADQRLHKAKAAWRADMDRARLRSSRKASSTRP